MLCLAQSTLEDHVIHPTNKLSIFAFTALFLSACGSAEDSDHRASKNQSEQAKLDSAYNSQAAQPKNPNTQSSNNSQSNFESIVALFDKGSFYSDPKIVDCTLSGGTKTSCVSITLKPQPDSMKIAPWCPRNISDSPEKSGVWFEGNKVYDADGAFIANMAKFHNDDVWQVFDKKIGKVNVTDTKVACEAAARPDVDKKYQNHCVECEVSYMDSGASKTFVIPIKPVNASKSNRIGRSGVDIAFSGALIDAAAPKNAILGAHTIAPFDDCGGYVNLHEGYHIHAITDKENCLKEVPNLDNHAPAIGLALDGYPIHRLETDINDLDRCGGRKLDSIGYHYHAAAPGKNQILYCHTGETGCSLDNSNSTCDASVQTDRRGPPPSGGRPDSKR